MTEYAHPLKNLKLSGGPAGTFWAPREIDGIKFVHAAQDYGTTGTDKRLESIKNLPCLFEGWNDQLGWHVRQGYPDGEIIQYAHLAERAAARAGQPMPQGLIFGVMGDTGFSQGEHLHLTISFKTPAQASAKLKEYGYSASEALMHIHYRLGNAMVNPVTLVGVKLPDLEEDEMQQELLYEATNGGQVYRRFVGQDGRSYVEKVGGAEREGLRQAAKEGKLALTEVNGKWTAGDIESIGLKA